MIIVKLKGGLGNQMFQYAYGKSLAIKNKTNLILDLSFLNDRTPRKNFQFRDYELNIFNINPEIKEIKQDELKSFNTINEPHFHFKPEVLSSSDNSYLDGYWQSEQYFKEHEEIIRQDFTFKNQLPENAKYLSEKIINSNSVCLHVRYGFMNNLKDRFYHGFVGSKYIHKSIDLIKTKVTNPVLFIFSDNHEWCKNNIKTDIPIYHVEDELELQNKDYFQLMTLCKHYIISNSSFSWWGAWLSSNSDKIVIAPKRWFRFARNNTKDLLPVNWIKI